MEAAIAPDGGGAGVAEEGADADAVAEGGFDTPGGGIVEFELSEAEVFDDADAESDGGGEAAMEGDGLGGERFAEGFAGGGGADLAAGGGVDQVAGDEIGLDIEDGGGVRKSGGRGRECVRRWRAGGRR